MTRVDLRAVESGLGADLLGELASVRAVVVGEAMLDGYVRGAVTRLCPEGPFPVVDASDEEWVLGGAGNVAANLAALGAEVRLVAPVGDDRAGERILSSATGYGVDTAGVVVDPDRRTLTKRRIVGDGRTLVRVDEGTTTVLDRQTDYALVRCLEAAVGGTDLAVVSDYRYGAVSDAVLDLLASRRDGVTLVVDSKNLGRFRPLRPTAVTSNYSEVMHLLGEAEVPSGRAEHIRQHGDRVLAETGSGIVAVTLDRDGVVVVEDGRGVTEIPTRSQAADPCGAGDTFTAAMALALAAGGTPVEAADLANRAAAIVVARPGTAVCSRLDLEGRREKWHPDTDALVDELDRRRAAGETVAFTNGCFDVLHAGHVASLQEAAELADILVVALNSDDSVRRLKGDDRPVNELVDRAAVLAGLSTVDYVVSFDEDSPLRLLRRLRPEVYCKGGDYGGRWIPEMELVRSWGGRFELTSYLPDRSTTATVERVRRVTVAGL